MKAFDFSMASDLQNTSYNTYIFAAFHAWSLQRQNLDFYFNLLFKRKDVPINFSYRRVENGFYCILG